jgi:hypothetical protein
MVEVCFSGPTFPGPLYAKFFVPFNEPPQLAEKVQSWLKTSPLSLKLLND